VTHRWIRLLHGLLAAAFLTLPLMLGGLYGAVLAGLPVPIFDELGGFLAASLGALGLGLGLASLGVVMRPERARALAVPLSAAFFGMALVRLAALCFGSALQAEGLGPALVAEVVSFSLVGTAVGISWPGAQPFSALLREFMGLLPRLPGRLKPWLVLLVLGISVAPLLAWGFDGARLLMLSQAVNLLGFVLYVHMGGLVRGLGLSHVVAWTMPLAVGVSEAWAIGVPVDVAGAALWTMVVLVGISLVVDLVDTVRWGLGDRVPMVGPRPPASAAPAAASPR
jgi:hypothetical protein